MRRRDVIPGVLSLIGATTVARAQAPRPLYRIGYHHPRTIAPYHPTLAILRSRSFEEEPRSLSGRPRTDIVQMSSPGFAVVAASFAVAAQKYRLPAISFLKAYARAGVLMTYGPNQEAYFPRAVILADKILKGEKPSDLPIEQPTRFDLVVNLKAAKALGLTIPQALLLRADEVIQ